MRLASLVVVALAWACLAGCTSTRQRLIRYETSVYVFHHSAQDLLAAAQKLLVEREFDLGRPKHALEVRTAWRSVSDVEDMAGSYERYVVIAQPLSPHHARLQAVRITLNTIGTEEFHPTLGGGGPKGREGEGKNVNTYNYSKGKGGQLSGRPTLTRDSAFEWELIQRLEPLRAQQLEARMTAYERRNGKDRSEGAVAQEGAGENGPQPLDDAGTSPPPPDTAGAPPPEVAPADESAPPEQ